MSIFTYDLSAKDRIIKSKVSLNRERPFFSYIILAMNVERTNSTENIPTMGVNQYGNLYWNEDFVNKLQDDELDFVLAHETMHVATLTFQRQGKRNHMLWNIATDLVINYILRNEGFNPPKDIVMADHKGIWTFTSGKTKKSVSIDINDKVAEDVYDILMQHIDDVKITFDDGSGGSYKGSFDKHLPSDQNDNGKSDKEEKSGAGPTEADGAANEQKWKQKAAEANASAKMRGKGSTAIDRELNSILEPKIDWRKRLYQYITKDLPIDYTMRRPGRRFYATGFYMPSVVKENLEVLVGIDCSGSIDYSNDESEGAQFLSEVVGIADSFPQIKMRVIGWADGVLEEDDIEVTQQNRQKIKNFRPRNSGGTCLSSFTQYCKTKGYTTSRICVVLTDGYIENRPTLPDCNVLFVLSANGSDEIIKNHGEVTSLKDVER